MSSADQSLKRMVSPETEEAEPKKRQKQDGNNEVSSAAPEIAESAVEQLATADGGGTETERQTPRQEESQGNNDVSDEVPQLEKSVAVASTGAHTKESQTDSDKEVPTVKRVSTYREAQKKLKEERMKWTKILDRFMTHGNDTGRFSEELEKKGHDSRPPMPPDERRRLMEDLVKQSNISEPQDQNIEKYGLQPHVGLDFMSEFSTAVDSPKDAAAFLGIDLQSLEISPESALRLRIDQVQNIAFMVKKAEGIIKGCVNANDYGTGKTIEALASIFFLAQRRQARPDFDKHKAAFILCPHQALRSWQEAHEKYFSGLLTLRICSSALSPGKHSQLIDPPSASALAGFLSNLSPSDYQTSRTVIICTYSELSSHEFLTKRKQENVREKELSLRSSKLTDEALEALVVAQKPEIYDLNFNPEIIGTLIADEAHKIKHPKSMKAQAAYLLDADIHLLLTANPIDNKVSDFRGLLFALYKPKEWQMTWPEGEKFEAVLKLFGDHFDPFKMNLVPETASPEYRQALENGQHLWRLNPHAYRWLGHKMKFGPDFSRIVLGSIFRLCLLRRGVVSVTTMPSGTSHTISGILAMPPLSIRTIEVSMGHDEQGYKYLADKAFNLIFRDDERDSPADAARVINDNETPSGAFDSGWDAFLSHITADLGLNDVLRSSMPTEEPLSRDSVQAFDDMIRENTDAGMSFYYRMTRRESDPVQAPADRTTMIRYLVRRSPKLRWLLVKLEELKQKGEKVVIYCVHPLTQWLVEGICTMAEFNFLSLRSKPKHVEETRAAVIDDFNDPAKRYDFLLSTFRILGHSVDLHTDCHNMIIFELPESVPTMLSAIGRIRRVDQTRPQEVSILTMGNSYDDYTLHRQSRKHAISILAFGVLGKQLDDLALEMYERNERRRLANQWDQRKISRSEQGFLRNLEGEMPIYEVMKLLAAGELLRRHLGAQYNRSYTPCYCRAKIPIGKKRPIRGRKMTLDDFAGSNMRRNTAAGWAILKAS